MRKKPVLAVLLLAASCPSSAFAQERLPADWEQKVQSVVKDPSRATKVSEAGRLVDMRRQDSIAAVKKAREKLKEVFLTQGVPEDDRRISLQAFRDDRRKAAFQTFDPILELREIVSRAEWKEIWPRGYFAFPGPAPSLAVAIQQVLPSVVADPARRQQAMEVTASLVKAAAADESARKKETSRLEALMRDAEIPRDEFIESVAHLERAQEKMDDALVVGSGRLQKLLTKEEWAALTKSLSAPAP
jgi:hypothetical protein